MVRSDFAGEGTRNYFSDALGSITSLADSSSSLITRNDYDSFGEIVASSGSSQNSITYTGQRLDAESGLMALGNGERYYNPSYGRFIQQDSYAGMPDMPQSLNRFAYTYNNPFSYTDPSGNNPQEVGKSLTGNQTLDWYVRFGANLAYENQVPSLEKLGQSAELWNEWALGVGDAFEATGKFVADAFHDPVGTASNTWEGVKSLASDWSEIAQAPLETAGMLNDIFWNDPKMVMRELGKTSGDAVIAKGLAPGASLATAPIKAGIKTGIKKGLRRAKNSTIGKATTQVASHTVSKISSKATTFKTEISNSISKLNKSVDTYSENRAAIQKQAIDGERAGTGGGINYVNKLESNKITSQEKKMSCAAACGKQLLKDSGTSVKEAKVRDLANYSDEFGILAKDLAKALNKLDKDASYKGGSVGPEAFDILNKNGPWVAYLKPATGTHAVIVDGVKNGVVKIRDPWGGNAPGVGKGIKGTVKIEEFMELWKNAIHNTVFRSN